MNTKPVLIVGVCFALMLALGHAGAAAAETAEPRAQAKALLLEGARLMDERQYDKAVEAFQQAYQLVPSPKVLFNLGIAYLSVARYAEALEALEGFLKDAQDVPEASQLTARRHIADLRTKVASLAIKSNRSSADLTIDRRDYGTVTFDHALTIDPGVHELHARAGDKSQHLHFSAQAGATTELSLLFDGQGPAVAPTARLSDPALTPSATAAEPLLLTTTSSPPPPLYRRPWVWVAAGGVVAVAATVILVLALSHTEYPTPDATLPGP